MESRASILIVDDRPERLLALEAILEDLNENIVRAYSGRDALRQLLTQDFAVILLDVNMPDMDGFETAGLIRRRKNSEHIPIIFITAFGDEMLAARGYSLGAVDYILTPVVPDVLRTKVMVFVDLFKKNQQVRRQSESLRRRAGQMQRLASASVAINSALSIDKMLQTLTDTARQVIGSHQAITLFIDPRSTSIGGSPRPGRKIAACASYSDKYADWRGQSLQLDAIADTAVFAGHTATRLSESELIDHPDWEIVRQARMPPISGGILAAPLTGRDGTRLGGIYLSDRGDGPFTADDESIAVQLAQMASIAIENSLFAEEHEANRLKDEFLATISHELRTPLNAILGWTHLLRMQELSGDVAHGMEVIERNVKAQAKLIDDLLDVSRITTGKLRLNLQDMRLESVIDAAVDAIRPVAAAKNLSLEVSVDPAIGVIRGDSDRLGQVVWNLLTNATKFTSTGGRVRVTARRNDPATVDLCVSDTGIGISRQFLPHVFDRFRQADSTSTRAHGGLGIGLSIVRHIVELHGGSVGAESDGEGQGATFHVTLPAKLSVDGAASDSVAETEASASSNGNGEQTATESITSALRSVSAYPLSGVDLSGTRILLVDDEADARELLSEVLRRCGADVVSADSAQQAMKVLSDFRPHVLVSDIAMPGSDGYQLIQRVRELPWDQGSQTPAIALTAYAHPEDVRRALAAGFQAHLIKPVEPDALVQALDQLIHVVEPVGPPNSASAHPVE